MIEESVQEEASETKLRNVSAAIAEAVNAFDDLFGAIVPIRNSIYPEMQDDLATKKRRVCPSMLNDVQKQKLKWLSGHILTAARLLHDSSSAEHITEASSLLKSERRCHVLKELLVEKLEELDKLETELATIRGERDDFFRRIQIMQHGGSVTSTAVESAEEECPHPELLNKFICRVFNEPEEFFGFVNVYVHPYYVVKTCCCMSSAQHHFALLIVTLRAIRLCTKTVTGKNCQSMR